MINKLEIRLLNYFILIMIASLMIGIEFYFEMSNPVLGHKICENVSISSFTGSVDIEPTLFYLRNKILIMFIVLTIVVLIVMTMFIKNITHPLRKISDAAYLINNGDLSHVIKIENKDEIGDLANAFNELTSNLQECSKFSSTAAMNTLNNIKSIEGSISPETEIYKNIMEIKSNMESILEFSNTFTLLDTELQQ